MDVHTFSPKRREALSELLDDTSATTRHALKVYFLEHPKAAQTWLSEVAKGHNRHLSWHARWFLETLRFTNPVNEFRSFIQSLQYELETGAILLSRTVLPETNPGSITLQLDEMAARCRELIVEPTGMRQRCQVINRVLFHEYGLRGNRENYDDPLNSFISHVLDSGKGIPVTLSIIYLLVAHRLDIPLEPVGLPGHFLIGCYQDNSTFFIDAFEQGVFRTREEILSYLHYHHPETVSSHIAPVPVREVLCRCCRNLVRQYKLCDEPEKAELFESFIREFEMVHIKASML